MASVHEYINYGLNEVKELFDTCIIQAVIIQVNHEDNTADIETTDYGRVNDAPIFYHCEGKTTVDNGHTAFQEDDQVDVICVNARGSSFIPQMKIVGFSDGSLQRCVPDSYVVFTVKNVIDSSETCIVWDIRKNLPAEIPGVSFPCAPSEIASWREELYTAEHYRQLYDYPSDIPADEEYGRGWSMTDDNFPDFSTSCDISEAHREIILNNGTYDNTEVYDHPATIYCGSIAKSSDWVSGFKDYPLTEYYGVPVTWFKTYGPKLSDTGHAIRTSYLEYYLRERFCGDFSGIAIWDGDWVEGSSNLNLPFFAVAMSSISISDRIYGTGTCYHWSLGLSESKLQKYAMVRGRIEEYRFSGGEPYLFRTIYAVPREEGDTQKVWSGAGVDIFNGGDGEIRMIGPAWHWPTPDDRVSPPTPSDDDWFFYYEGLTPEPRYGEWTIPEEEAPWTGEDWHQGDLDTYNQGQRAWEIMPTKTNFGVSLHTPSGSSFRKSVANNKDITASDYSAPEDHKYLRKTAGYSWTNEADGIQAQVHAFYFIGTRGRNGEGGTAEMYLDTFAVGSTDAGEQGVRADATTVPASPDLSAMIENCIKVNIEDSGILTDSPEIHIYNGYETETVEGKDPPPDGADYKFLDEFGNYYSYLRNLKIVPADYYEARAMTYNGNALNVDQVLLIVDVLDFKTEILKSVPFELSTSEKSEYRPGTWKV